MKMISKDDLEYLEDLSDYDLSACTSMVVDSLLQDSEAFNLASAIIKDWKTPVVTWPEGTIFAQRDANPCPIHDNNCTDPMHDPKTELHARLPSGRVIKLDKDLSRGSPPISWSFWIFVAQGDIYAYPSLKASYHCKMQLKELRVAPVRIGTIGRPLNPRTSTVTVTVMEGWE